MTFYCEQCGNTWSDESPESCPNCESHRIIKAKTRKARFLQDEDNVLPMRKM